MSAEQTDTMQWYFCFRVLNPPGSWVVQGPFATSDMAKAAREKAKVWGGDGEIGTPFPARTREEAERKCETGQTY